MMISFYFYCNTIKAKETVKINLRIQRILIPYLFWSIFLFICNNILIAFIFEKSFILIFQILLIIAYIFQYSYWNLIIFNKYSTILKYPLGSFCELLPFAVTGITISYLKITIKLKNFKRLAIFFSITIIFLTLEFDIFVMISGFIYQGILLNIGAICIFILFSIFSIQNKNLVFLLKIITKFTGGIFYIHFVCFSLLKLKFFFIKNKTFYGSVVIYLISYITCYFGNKLSGKTKFKFLFN